LHDVTENPKATLRQATVKTFYTQPAVIRQACPDNYNNNIS